MRNRPAAHTNLDEYFENEHLESGSQVLPADELMANEYLWSQVTMGEHLVEIVQYALVVVELDTVSNFISYAASKIPEYTHEMDATCEAMN
jgi:hypothetical protein